MEANAWKPLFWAQVAEVKDRGDRVRELIFHTALPLLKSPSLWRAESRRLERSLEEASGRLTEVIALAQATAVVGLLGPNWHVPMAVPPPSVDHVRHEHGRNDHATWLALRRLEGAKEHAQDALTRVERSRHRLFAALTMPRLPMRHDAVVEAERHEAQVELSAALREAVNMTFLAGLAKKPPMNIGIN